MLFSKAIVKEYQKRMFARYDDTKTVFYFSPDDFEGLKAEPFAFPGHTGQKLQGYFYSYENPIPGRMVVFDHGMGGGHRAYMKEINRLAKHGFLVFSYDHTGCMESEGENTNGFAQSLNDLDHCLTALKECDRCEGRTIAVMGHSWGAYSTQNICGLHPDVTHIVALSGPISVKQIVDQSFSGWLKGYRKTIYQLETEANPEYVNRNAIDALKSAPTKALLIHSADDPIVKGEYHFNLLRDALKARPNTEFYEVNGKAHSPNYAPDAVQYKDAFFAELQEKTKSGQLSDDASCKAFLERFDWHRMTEQDEEVWAKIFEHLDR